MRYILTIILFSSIAISQKIDASKYYEFLESNQNMTYDELLEIFPAGKFGETNITNYQNSKYFDDFSIAMEPTNDELELLGKNGFYVTERKSYSNFVQAYYDIWINDLPVYISADAILQAWHHSYEKLMMGLENEVIYAMVKDALDKSLSEIKASYNTDGSKVQNAAIQDAKIYLEVATQLLSENQFSSDADANKIINSIKDEQTATLNLFGAVRVVDFSQMKPRSRYTRTKRLSQYFQSMMWLGRTEILLGISEETQVEFEEGWSLEEVEARQLLMSVIISKAFETSGALGEINEVNDILTDMLGRQDNINLNQILEALEIANINDISTLENKETRQNYLKELSNLENFSPLYNSEVMFSNPNTSDKIIPRSSFKLLGQRAILDGFVQSSVVYDNIFFNGDKVKRMLPNSLDILFSLGNDASIQLLDDEFNRYPYASNLSACRYLIDNIDEDFWGENLYASWLKTIKTLNPKSEEKREELPSFMQTAGWQQKNMTTQLGSWAQLRHDYLLYAKQPYSGGIGCKFPDVFVEPIPEFYSSAKKMVLLFKNILDDLDTENQNANYKLQMMKSYIENFENAMDKLEIMSTAQIEGNPFSQEEIDWAKCMISASNPVGCDPATTFDGWYINMYFGTVIDENWFGKSEDKFNVADIHTAPTDENGTMVGWVQHVGTGPVNLAVISTQNAKGEETIFTGPVLSYYEFVSSGFKRLTNDDWMVQFFDANERKMKSEYELFSGRPQYSKYYLANKLGKTYSNWDKLETFPAVIKSVEESQEDILVIEAYPNPFKNNFTIAIENNNYQNANIEIHNMQGDLILEKNLSSLPNGNSLLNISELSSSSIANGVYLVTIKSGSSERTVKIVKD